LKKSEGLRVSSFLAEQPSEKSKEGFPECSDEPNDRRNQIFHEGEDERFDKPDEILEHGNSFQRRKRKRVMAAPG
jgi:hypothetical protein